MIRVNLLKAESKDIGERSPALGAESAEKKSKDISSEKKAKKTPPGNLIIFLAIILLGGGFLLQKRSLDKERTLLSEAQDEQRRLQPVVNKLDELEWQKQYLEMKVSLIRTLRAQQGTAVRIMDEISRALPDWVWLTEVTEGKTGLSLKGRALSNVLISDYVRSLESCGLFAAVGIVTTQQRTEGNNQFLEFTLTAVLPPPVPHKPAAAQTPEAR